MTTTPGAKSARAHLVRNLLAPALLVLTQDDRASTSSMINTPVRLAGTRSAPEIRWRAAGGACVRRRSADLVAEAVEFAVDAPMAQVGVSVARRRIRARTPAGMAGRPGRVCGMVQRRRKRCRCQRRIVDAVNRRSAAATGGRESDEGDQGSIGSVAPWPRSVALQHGRLMTQDEISLAASEQVRSTI
jgi:hypothetical protein